MRQFHRRRKDECGLSPLGPGGRIEHAMREVSEGKAELPENRGRTALKPREAGGIPPRHARGHLILRYALEAQPEDE
jgi:hypothetical protein